MLDNKNIDDYDLFDKSKIDNLILAIGNEKALEFLNNYLTSLKQQYPVIIQNIIELDYYKIEFAAHKLASGAGTFGHMKLHHLLLYIEDVAREKDPHSLFKSQESLSLVKSVAVKSIELLEGYIS